MEGAAHRRVTQNFDPCIKVHTPAYLDNYEIKFKVYSHYDKAAPVCYSENAREGDICRFSVIQQMINFIIRQSQNQ